MESTRTYKTKEDIEARIEYLLHKTYRTNDEKLWIGGQINALRWVLNLVKYPEEF